jgi:hypothetical protein
VVAGFPLISRICPSWVLSFLMVLSLPFWVLPFLQSVNDIGSGKEESYHFPLLPCAFPSFFLHMCRLVLQLRLILS